MLIVSLSLSHLIETKRFAGCGLAAAAGTAGPSVPPPLPCVREFDPPQAPNVSLSACVRRKREGQKKKRTPATQPGPVSVIK